MPKFALVLSLAILVFAASPVLGQEFFIHNGVTHEIDSPHDDSYAYAIGYMEGLGEHAAWSITYLNEGHVSTHKRDGLAVQLWARKNIAGRRLSLAAGLGPYLYYDTHIRLLSTGRTFTDDHAVGGIASVAATLYLAGPLFLQARANWIETVHNISTFSATAGIGFRLESSQTPGPLTGHSGGSQPSTYNELTLMVGRTTFNSIEDPDALAESFEYRRNLGRNFAWTIGWLDEGHPISRTGPITQLWARRSFYNDHLDLGVGFGPYLGFDRRGLHEVRKVVYLASATGSIRFASHWALRGTWHRVTTTTDRDTDIYLVGVGYRF